MRTQLQGGALLFREADTLTSTEQLTAFPVRVSAMLLASKKSVTALNNYDTHKHYTHTEYYHTNKHKTLRHKCTLQ